MRKTDEAKRCAPEEIDLACEMIHRGVDAGHEWWGDFGTECGMIFHATDRSYVFPLALCAWALLYSTSIAEAAEALEKGSNFHEFFNSLLVSAYFDCTDKSAEWIKAQFGDDAVDAYYDHVYYQ